VTHTQEIAYDDPKDIKVQIGQIDIPVDEDVMKFFQRRLKYMFMDLGRDVEKNLAKVK